MHGEDASEASFPPKLTGMPADSNERFFVDRAQFWLYLFGAIISACISGGWDGVLHINGSNDRCTLLPPSSALQHGLTVSCIFIQAVSGIAVGFLVGKKGNIERIVGTLLSLVLTTIFQIALLPRFREDTLTGQVVLGMGVIIVSTYMYYYYKSIQLRLTDAESNPDRSNTPLTVSHHRSEGTPADKLSTDAGDSLTPGRDPDDAGREIHELEVMAIVAPSAHTTSGSVAPSTHLPAPKLWWIGLFASFCIIGAGVAFYFNPPAYSKAADTTPPNGTCAH